jgi:hypothetical protein
MEARKSADYLTYCGLYCKMCSIVATIPRQAETLLNQMKGDGWEFFGSEIYPEFPVFWEILGKLAVLDKSTLLCIGGCGDPDCAIRKCAVSRGLQVCALCDEFPCQLLIDFTRRYPFLIKNNERIREIGVEAWLEEQDALVARGVTYSTLCEENPPSDQ